MAKDHKPGIFALFAIGLMSAHGFEIRSLVPAIVQAIFLTLAFLAYAYANHRLGNWTGKFTILVFWLAMEYFFLRLP